MKSEGEEITIDEFRLELERLKKAQEQLKLEKEHYNSFSIYNIKELPISISSLSSWVYFTLHYLWLIHLIVCYLWCFQAVYGNGVGWIKKYVEYLRSASTIGYIINTPFIILAAISIIFWNEQKQGGMLTVLNYIGTKTTPYLRYIIEFTLYSTAFFALSATIPNLILFVIASFITLINITLLQNFTLRKDQFFCKSFQFLLLHKLVKIVSLSLGVISLNINISEGPFLVFVILQLLLGLVSIISYFNFGTYTFRHKLPRFLLFYLNILYCTASLAMFFDIVQAFENGSFNFFVLLFFCSLVSVYSMSCTLERKRRMSQVPENKNLKQKVYFLFNKLQNIEVDNEDDSEIRGLLSFHFICGCLNPHCVVNFVQVYDSKKKKTCSIKKISQSRVSLVKFYIKCLFQNALQQDPQNLQLILDYLEFYYLKLKNIFIVLKLIIQLQKKLLSPNQRLRLVRLKRILQQQNNTFAQDLFLGKLKMQHVIKSQEVFDKIVNGIDLVLARNSLFWRYIARNDVFLVDILEIAKSNFNLVDKLNDQWLEISTNFDINRRWKFYFLCFTAYIKNQKLKPSMIQDFGNRVEYDSIFKTGNYFIDKTTEKQALYNPIILFQQNTSFLVANCDEENMLIKRVSKYFSRSFEYQRSQVQGSHLHELMPNSIRSFHHKMFVSWVKQGKNRNQNLYSTRKITPITKRGYLLPCFKFYKYYVLNSGEIQYISLFKRNKKEQMIILTNSRFQIQAITYNLAQKLRIRSSQDYRHFQGLNLLTMVPMLAKYTHYLKYIHESDEDFIQPDDNQTLYKKQISSVQGHTQQSKDILGMKKQLHLSNMKLLVPTDFEQAKHDIKNKRQFKNYFEVVRQCYTSLRKKKKFIKFKVELNVREKDYAPFTSQKFYQIQINELEQNNRLQKMKQEQEKIGQLNQIPSKEEIGSSAILYIDTQMFLQLNKKKNRVVFSPSDNIFIKEQHNQILQKISHITNIKTSIRLIVLLLVCILIAMFGVEMSVVEKLETLNIQFYWVGMHQKMNFLLSSQYNIQHMQPGNAIQQSFYIVFYTHNIMSSFQNATFQNFIYDPQLNPQQELQPYFKGKYIQPILYNITQAPVDQITIFQYLHQSTITLHRMVQKDPTDKLQCQEYHIFNNYLYSYYNLTQNLKQNIIDSFNDVSDNLASVITWLGILELILIIFCFLFGLSRLIKVTNGFSELVSIFIQMDSKDIRKISKFVSYVVNLFDHLKEKYNKMRINYQESPRSTSLIKDLQRPSSQLSKTQQLMAISVGANLNKKIKKIDFGTQISLIKKTTLLLMLLYLFLITCIFSITVIYSLASLTKLTERQQMGFDFIANISVTNAITTGVLQKFRNASIFRSEKYTQFFNTLNDITQQHLFLTLSSFNNQFGQLIKTVYFQDFCQQRIDIFNSTFKEQLQDTCGVTANLSPETCAVLKKIITDSVNVNRCQTIQNSFLSKGVTTFYNYFLLRTLLYFNNGSNLTTKDAVQINDVLKIIGIFEVQIMEFWLEYVSSFVSARLITLIVIITSSLVVTLVLHVVFVEYLIKNYLSEQYGMFRRMHEYMIPEFLINKEKIIKAKLIKQGFIKQ